MTGRDLIIYILKNNLEDKPIFEGERILGLLTVNEFAEKMGVGVATIHAWIELGALKYIKFGDAIFIPM